MVDDDTEFLVKIAATLDDPEGWKRRQELIFLRGRELRSKKMRDEAHIKATTYHTKAEIEDDDET